jgi:hypothetical protein
MSAVLFSWPLSTTGVAITFSILFTKTWRINRVLSGSTALRRARIRPQDVLWPLCVLLGLNITILALWTTYSPLHWNSQLYKDGEPGPWRGSCYRTYYLETAGIYFVLPLVFINVVALLLTNFQFWRARRLPR